MYDLLHSKGLLESYPLFSQIYEIAYNFAPVETIIDGLFIPKSTVSKKDISEAGLEEARAGIWVCELEVPIHCMCMCLFEVTTLPITNSLLLRATIEAACCVDHYFCAWMHKRSSKEKAHIV